MLAEKKQSAFEGEIRRNPNRFLLKTNAKLHLYPSDDLIAQCEYVAGARSTAIDNGEGMPRGDAGGIENVALVKSSLLDQPGGCIVVPGSD